HLESLDASHLGPVLARATDVGVNRIVTVGMDGESSAKGLAIAASRPTVSAAVGVHPWRAQDYPEGAPIDDLTAIAASQKVVAIGEIGLDFIDNIAIGLSYSDPNLRLIQERVFRDQLRLAKTLRLPVIVHSRGAHHRVKRILAEERMDVVGGCIQF